MAFSNHDVVPDSPINNFATLNPLIQSIDGSSITFRDGNLRYNAGGNPEVYFTANAESYYFEFIDDESSSNASLIILGSSEPKIGATAYYNITNHARIPYTAPPAGIDNRGSANLTITSGALFNMLHNYVISVYKKDSSTLILSSGGTNETVEIDVNGLGEDFIIGFISYTSTRSTAYLLNFGQDHTFGGTKTDGGGYQDANGQGKFQYQPPTGTYACCTKNLNLQE